jgi:hypothetical protein
MKSKWLGWVLILTPILWFVACEGPEGPQGPQGNVGPINQGYSYLGDDANTCNHCHDGTVSEWFTTGHHEAYEALVLGGDETNLYCVQCHTTGFDAEVEYLDSVVVNYGPDLTGFDDYWPPVTSEDSMRVEALKNVQCEACHGPMGPTIYEHAPNVNFYTGMIDDAEPSMCAKCHEQVEEWQESGHGMVLEHHGMTPEEFNDEFNAFSSCWECHTAEGFASANDSYWEAQGRPEMAHLIGCQGCHDPHDATNDHQLRNLDDVTVEYDSMYVATFTGYGNAQICVQCHHARRDNDHVADQIANGYDHFGPHGSPQMDMALGSGSYEIDGYTYSRTHLHQNSDESCVTCHMEMRSHSDPLGWSGGHTFEPTDATCQDAVCHSAAPPANWDYGGTTTEIDGLMTDLETLIGVDPEYYGDPDSTTVDQRMAAYAYVFVANDGSHGVHNPEYARSLLENAIDYLNSLP